jgi:hypothetical protein
MKTLLAGVALVVIAGCYTSKEMQVEIVKAELIRIDTINRYSNIQKQVLTWKDEFNMEYVSFAEMNQVYVLGTKIPMLKTR